MTIAVDTSAIVAIMRNEPEAPLFLEIMLAATDVLLSAAAYTEAGIVMDAASPRRRKPASNLGDNFDALLTELGATIVPVTHSTARLARAAYLRYGKGTGHKAALNFGDCFSYALASERAAPLLFKGNDFAHTDIAVCH